MENQRKFYKTIFEITVLSEDSPYVFNGINELAHDVTDGEFSGEFKLIEEKELTGEEMMKALIDQGSNSDFFQLGDEENG